MKLNNLLEAKYAGKPPEMPIGNSSKSVAVIPIYISGVTIKRIVNYINESMWTDYELRPITVEEVLSNSRLFKVIIWDFYDNSLETGLDLEEYWNSVGWDVNDIHKARGERLP